MGLDDSVTYWIDGLRDGNGTAAQKLWERYFERIVQLADARLPRGVRRGFDEEDVAISAFRSLCRGARKGVFPDLADRDNLWSLLVVITARKAMQQVRKANAAKRGGGDVRGESVFDGANEKLAGIEGVISQEPTPEFATSASEEFESLLALLPDEEMKQLAVMKMEGYTNQEIANHLDCGLRTIERRLGLIRDLWRIRS